MKKEGLQADSALTPKQDAPGETRTVIDEMLGEVKRRSEIERGDDLERSLPVRILLASALASAFAAAVVGGYGIYNFPDAPLRQNGEVYTGKHGQPRTKEDYEKFVLWKNALFVAFGSTFFFGFAFGIADSREKRRRRSAA
jgi:hypothetical protein